MIWVPNSTDLPQAGTRIYSQKLKNLFYDIYNKLNIVNTLNAGITAPIEPSTGMPWVDTSSDITVKIYDSVNTLWHTLAQYSDINYTALVSNSAVGTGSTQVAQGDHNHTLSSLSDIDVTNICDGDTVVWDSANSKWNTGAASAPAISELIPFTITARDSQGEPTAFTLNGIEYTVARDAGGRLTQIQSGLTSYILQYDEIGNLMGGAYA